jgi:hypothetical protein
MPLLHDTVNNALGLVVDMLNVCEFKVTSTTMVYILLFKKKANKVYIHFWDMLYIWNVNFCKEI